MPNTIDRRQFLAASGRALSLLAGGLTTGGAALGLSGCSGHSPERYTERDEAALAAQQIRERELSGTGPFGVHRYKGYRGLAELPWFEIDSFGVLRMVDESVPQAIDMHCHFGMSLLFKPKLDLLLRTERVRHLLDCDETNPGCDLDLDVYINANFDDPALERLQCETLGQGTFGSEFARTQTIPNLLAEMDATRVEQAMILPIAFNLPFGDDLAERWREAIVASDSSKRLLAGASVHPRDVRKIERLEAFAEQGARVVKMHPTVQAFYPDEPDAMEIYEAAERLGMVIFFHGGRAGIEPASRQPFALPRHYEGALAAFPNLSFVLGHAGARDGEDMLELGLRYENAWFGLHGQGITHLDTLIRRIGGERLLFGTDWPFYHLAATLAKVLIVTDTPDRAEIRHAILRGNAERLLA
jgi:predicted TIM-barrel fold metal-dependent hydrolase